MSFLKSFESDRYSGTIDAAHEPFPSVLTWIHGNRMATACANAVIPTLRVFIGMEYGYPCFSGMAIDSAELPALYVALGEMQSRCNVKNIRIQLHTRRIQEETTAIHEQLARDHADRRRIVETALSTAGLTEDLDPGLAARIDGFVSGTSLLRSFCALNTGAEKASKEKIWTLFEASGTRPSMTTPRSQMLRLYMLDCAGRFLVSTQERLASIQRAQVIHQLTTLSTQLRICVPVTLSQLGSAAWRNDSVRSVHGLPWIVRDHVFRHVCQRAPWKPAFVADRLTRYELVRIPGRQSLFVDACEHRFVNTRVSWYRNDPFLCIPRALLELVCTFVCRQDMIPLIDSSRTLATACCLLFRRPHAQDSLRCEQLRNNVCSCGQLRSLVCVQSKCGTCCTGTDCGRHGRKRQRD